MFLEDSTSQRIYEHDTKAALLWNSYKERLGTSEYTSMHFDLDTLITQAEDLDWQQDPFTKEEIDKTVQALPHNKSPGPDGFNSDFIK